MGKKYRSEALAAIHETMEALHDVGAIDKRTMRRFDVACLTPVKPLTPRQIRAIREREHVSQAVFANYLNVTSSLVSKWAGGRLAEALVPGREERIGRGRVTASSVVDIPSMFASAEEDGTLQRRACGTDASKQGSGPDLEGRARPSTALRLRGGSWARGSPCRCP